MSHHIVLHYTWSAMSLGRGSSHLGKGQMGSALMGSLRISCFLTGTCWLLPLTDVYLPKSARAYLFLRSVKNHYFCSGTISVDPIRPQPNETRPCRHATMPRRSCSAVSAPSEPPPAAAGDGSNFFLRGPGRRPRFTAPQRGESEQKQSIR